MLTTEVQDRRNERHYNSYYSVHPCRKISLNLSSQNTVSFDLIPITCYLPPRNVKTLGLGFRKNVVRIPR